MNLNQRMMEIASQQAVEDGKEWAKYCIKKIIANSISFYGQPDRKGRFFAREVW